MVHTVANRDTLPKKMWESLRRYYFLKTFICTGSVNPHSPTRLVMSLLERHSSYKTVPVSPHRRCIGTRMLLVRAKVLVNALLPIKTDSSVFAPLPTHVTADIITRCLAEFCYNTSTHYRECLFFAFQELAEVARQQRRKVCLFDLQAAHNHMIQKTKHETKKIMMHGLDKAAVVCNPAKRRKHAH